MDRHPCRKNFGLTFADLVLVIVIAKETAMELSSVHQLCCCRAFFVVSSLIARMRHQADCRAKCRDVCPGHPT